MGRWKFGLVLTMVAAGGMLAGRFVAAQEVSAKPPLKEDGRKLEKPRGDEGSPKRARPADTEDPPRKPPRDNDFDGPPAKPGEEGFEGPGGKPPRERDVEGAPAKPPREGAGVGRSRPPREGDMDRPVPPDREGRPGPDRRPLTGPPRWPHEDWQSMERNDPEMYKLLKEDADLERQTREQVMQYRQAPKAEREKIKKQVEDLVNKHFEARQQRRSLELKRLEEELKRLREAMERREASRKELVEKRVSELLGREDELGF